VGLCPPITTSTSVLSAAQCSNHTRNNNTKSISNSDVIDTDSFINDRCHTDWESDNGGERERGTAAHHAGGPYPHSLHTVYTLEFFSHGIHYTLTINFCVPDALSSCCIHLNVLYIIHADYVGRRAQDFESVCLFVRSITQKPMIPVFKLGIGNDLGISYKWHGFGLKGQR